ncbi:MAG: response regulator [Lachnospiraceae bacterium]
MMDYSIVVAEDEELLLEGLVDRIEQLDINFKVIGKAQTGCQAYDLVQELSPDLVITDIRMPEMDGIALLQKIRENFPTIDFIITSGYSDFAYAKTAIHLQVSDYLLKPIDPEELREALYKLKTKYELIQSAFHDIINSNTGSNTPAQIALLLKEYLVQNYNHDINFNLIANQMNYSPSYLTKIFYAHYECSPSKYLISLRMQRAKYLLSHCPELTVRQVGESAGYDDQGYFSRIFKKQTGLTPLEYKEKF